MDRITKAMPWVEVMNLYSISECHDVATSDLKQEMEIIKVFTLNQEETYSTHPTMHYVLVLPSVTTSMFDQDHRVSVYLKEYYEIFSSSHLNRLLS